MKRVVLLWALLTALRVAQASAQITVTAGGAPSVPSANDFATATFQDPWDMNERTDVGWWLNSVDFPFAGFSGTTFLNGLFTGIVNPATPAGGVCPTGNPSRCADPNLWLLETGLPNRPPVGKNGNAFSINANVYRIVAVRMRLAQPGYMLFHWSTNTIYDAPGLQTAGISGAGAAQAPTTAGWRIYFVDLASLSLTPGGTEPWNGTKRSLRFDPVPDDATPGSVVEIDWIRLVDQQPALTRTVSWTGAGGPVDLYLDNDTAPTNDPNQTLGMVAQNVSGSGFSLNAGALAPGTYYVGVRRSGTNDAFTYSSTAYQVNGPATVQVISPSDEGSADDFATVQLGNPWDMTSLSDIDTTFNVTSPSIATIPSAQTEAGAALGNITTFFGTSTPGTFNPGQCTSGGDPVVYLLRSDVRGRVARIDPNKYRILTAELGIPDRARDLCGGSVARVFWQAEGAPAESHTWDIPINSRVGANVLNRINLDMATVQLDPGSPGQQRWAPGITAGLVSFRIDPHEFPNPTSFFYKRVKLAALEKSGASYTIRWTASKVGGTVRVYYDADRIPTNMTLIGSTAATTLSGSMVWNALNVPQGGQHFIYVEFDDGININGAYSKWPVVIDHNATGTARLVLSRSALNFGIRGLTTKTPAQVVRLTVLDAPVGQPCWTVDDPELWFIQVSPRSGCGSALLTVSLMDRDYPFVGEFTGVVRVRSAGAINSPQGLQTTVRMGPSSSPPSGTVDTPVAGAVVEGPVAITGWAIDDIGVARVTICRDAVAGEAVPPNPACGAGQIYIGDAVFVADARPDLEMYTPTTPLNYRAGWGLLVLSNVLPSQGVGPGTGTYVLHARAIDVEGQQTALGSRSINAQNAAAGAPFGTIDTPGNGESISGAAYPNYGWVLSRVRRADPPGGGSVVVYVDGVAVGSPGSWTSRPDLSSVFAAYPGVQNALGVFGLNTFAYADGLHTISWGVTDVAGVTSGIGSRFFSIYNNGPAALAGGAMRPTGPDLGRRVDDLTARQGVASLEARHGFRLSGASQSIEAGLSGARRVYGTERDRLEIRLSAAAAAKGASYAGYQLVSGRLRELPVGSSFDPERGVFYWQPGLGYLGDFDLLFVRTQADGSRERIPVTVTLRPRPTLRAASAVRDPWAGMFLLN